jgi:hypothetical protein
MLCRMEDVRRSRLADGSSTLTHTQMLTEKDRELQK